MKMQKIIGEKLRVKLLDKHSFIGDLLYLDGPILSLFRTPRQNWLYLWCDTDGEYTERWLIFSVSRENLISYMKLKSTLLNVINAAPVRMITDIKKSPPVSQDDSWKLSKTLTKITDTQHIINYLPASDSFFDEALAPNISTAQELSPTKYEVPIAGDWLCSDLDKFSTLYSQIYSFLYCTTPQFLSSISDRVESFLRAPWEGGFSRVHLFSGFSNLLPSFHDLEISKLKYNSPGEIEFEALQSIGISIENLVIKYIDNEKELIEIEKRLNSFLSENHLKKINLSMVGDANLNISPENIIFLKDKVAALSSLLGIKDEIDRLILLAPNIVIAAKVSVAVLVRVKKLAGFQQSGHLNYSNGHGSQKTALDLFS